MVLLWRAAPHLHFRERPQIPHLRGDRDQIGAPPLLLVFRGPLLCRKCSLGAWRKGPGSVHTGRDSE